MSPEEIAAACERANARLDARPGYVMRCAWCGHTDSVPTDPEREVYTCDQCGTRTSYGVPMVRITHQPHPDRRFLLARYDLGNKDKPQSLEYTIDRHYGTMIALDLLSVCDPEAWNALMAWKKSQTDAGGAAPAPTGAPAAVDVPVAAPATIQ